MFSTILDLCCPRKFLLLRNTNVRVRMQYSMKEAKCENTVYVLEIIY